MDRKNVCGGHAIRIAVGITMLVIIAIGVAAGTDINSCTTISSAGNYVLTTNINNASTCIIITSSNVTFDGAGYAINGTNTWGTAGVYVSFPNVTVKNLIVTNWNYGIYYQNANNGNITNNTASMNYNTGIFLRYSNNNTLANNTAKLNEQEGIWLASSNNNTLTHNIASSNTYNGIMLYESSNNNTLTNNIASSNPYSSGIILIYSSNDNTLTNNIASSNGQYGIYIAVSSNNNTLTNNNVSLSWLGIYLDSSSNNKLTNNTVSSNSRYGINIYTSSNNTLTNNTASLNSYSGIYLYSSSNNNITSNNASNNGAGILLENSCNNNALTSNNASSNTEGIYLYGYSNNNTLTNNTASLNSYSGIYLYSSSNNNLINNNASNNTLWTFFSSSNSTNNTVINLIMNPTISFTGKDVAIQSSSYPAPDPDGYKNISKFISANNNSADSWLFLNISYNESDIARVNKDTLRMWKYNSSWSQVSGINGVETTDNYVYANITSFSIFAPMADVPPLSITNLQNTTYAQTYINWTWTDPTDPDFSKVMIYLNGTFQTNVTNGTQYFNATGLAFNTSYEISTHTVDTSGNINQTWENHTAKTALGRVHNINKGIDYLSIQAAIDSASIGDEIHADSGTYYEDLIINKRLTLIGLDGPIIDGNNSINNIIDITANNVTLEGFNIRNTTQPYVGAGIYILSDYNIIRNNNFTNVSFGLYADNSNHNNITNNNFTNTYYGIRLLYSDDNTIMNNNASDNNLYASTENYGIFLKYSNRNILSNNILNNNDYGMYTMFSNDNIINYNKANGNGNKGIALFYSSNNNSIQDNIIYNSGDVLEIYRSNDTNAKGNKIFNGRIIFYITNNYTLMDNDISFGAIDIISSNKGKIYNNNLSYGNGISVTYSNQIDISNNNIFYNFLGLYLSVSINCTLKNNNISFNGNGPPTYDNAAIFLQDLSNYTIYNNIFNNTKDFLFDTNNGYWNVTKTPSINIISCPYIGGNYWAKPDGTGFSQTCEDANKDGICDTNYTLESGNIDYLPLAAIPSGYGFITGYVLNNSLGISNSFVTTNTSNSTTTDPSGFYSLLVPSGTYNLTVKKEPEFYSNISVVVAAISGTTVAQDIELIRKLTGNISGIVSTV